MQRRSHKLTSLLEMLDMRRSRGSLHSMHQDVVFPCLPHHLCKKGEASDAHEKHARLGACHTYVLLRKTPSGMWPLRDLLQSDLLMNGYRKNRRRHVLELSRKTALLLVQVPSCLNLPGRTQRHTRLDLPLFLRSSSIALSTTSAKSTCARSLNSFRWFASTGV